MTKALIVTHGDLGKSLLRTSRIIVGKSDGIKVISNDELSMKGLINEINSQLEKWKESEILILVDFLGGSCWNAAKFALKGRKSTALISGVNMPILLSFITKNDEFELGEMVKYLKQAYTKAMQSIP